MIQSRHNFKQNLLIIAGLICIVVFYTRDGILRPFWFDEAVTITNFMLLPSISKIYHAYVIPNNHIVYTAILKLWFELYSPEIMLDLFLRLPSLIFGMTAVIIIYCRWRKRFGMLAAVTAAGCLASTPAFSIYAVAVRGYMLAFLLVLIGLELAGCWMTKRNWYILSGYFLVAWLAVGVMPTCIFAFIAIILLFFPLPLSRSAIIRWLPLAIIPPAAAAVFYVPILPSLLKAAALKEGWSSPVAAMVTFYSAVIIAVLPLLPAVLWQLPWQRRRNYAVWRLLLTCCIMLLPVLFFLIRSPAPFPRIFFPLLPVWLFLLCRSISQFVAVLRLKRIRYSTTWLFAALSIVFFWGLFQHSVAEFISDKIVADKGVDDYFSPYYIRSSYNPAGMIKKLQQLSGKTVPDNTYISFMADPYPIGLYGRLCGIDEESWHFDNPRRKVLPDQQLNWAVLWSGRINDEIAQFSSRFPDRKISLAADCGYHRIYFVSRQSE